MKRLIVFFMDQASRRSRQWYYEGMTQYRRKRNGSWSEGFALRGSHGDHEYTKETEHPLWLLESLAKVQGESQVVGRDELVGGVETTRYSLALTEGEMSHLAWTELAQPDAAGSEVPPRWSEPPPRSRARSAIPVQVWLDVEGRIRRMGFELEAWHPATIEGQEQTFDPVWSVTELWDFGVEINRQPPVVSG